MFLTICTQVSVYSTSTVVCTSGFKMNIRNCGCIYQSTKTNKWNKKAISKVNGTGDINTVDFRMIYIKWKLHVIKFGVQKKKGDSWQHKIDFCENSMTSISNICVITTTLFY